MQKDLMNFHFYITCYKYYENEKLETRHEPAVDELHAITGTLSSIGVYNHQTS